jgi:hypothetical protein
MQSLKIQTVNVGPENFILYPDFILTSMLRTGICAVEADHSLQKGGAVEFILKERQNSASVIGHVSISHFRNVLARFAVMNNLGNPYGGHILFAIDFERNGKLHPHRFSLFLCNEPTQAFWLKLYLYCIDGIFPLKEESN